MKNKVTLYIAEHNVTGLKYFGKTTKYFTEKDLQEKYHGSGTYWKRHIKKHGDDVSMSIYRICSLDENAEDYVEPIALKFSEENDIVDDYDNWANQTPENGLDGGDILETHSEEFKKKMSDLTKGSNNGMYGRKHTKESLKKMSDIKKGKIVSDKTKMKLSIANGGKNNYFFGKSHTEETKKKISEGAKNRKKGTCSYCGKICDMSNLVRWHEENCRHKIKKDI